MKTTILTGFRFLQAPITSLAHAQTVVLISHLVQSRTAVLLLMLFLKLATDASLSAMAAAVFNKVAPS